MSVPIPKLAGVCGWPIHHSLSPRLHQFWLNELKLPGAYVHFAVRPDDALRAFRSLKQTSISGVNITSPLKHLAFEAADIVSADAERLNVANCLYKKDGQLIAHNTDLEGFAAPLLKHFGAKNIKNVPALVIGTGGAVQAVIGALMSLNSPEIRLMGRNNGKAEDIAQSIYVPSLYAVPWESRQTSLKSSGLVINASAGGMTGKSPVDINLNDARPNTFIYDLVYTPLLTPLLAQAQAQGLPYIGGLEMLVGQARPSFKLFFGQTAPKDDAALRLLTKILIEKQA